MPALLTNSYRVDEYAIRYSNFVPRLFNFCLSLGMKPNRIMPSRAFCSDENQGYPIREGQIFPLTKFIPWAAYIQDESGDGYTLEQDELHRNLQPQSKENSHKIDLTEAIGSMKAEVEIRIHVDSE